MPSPEPLPLAALARGAELFDRGEWWHAHEAWEDGWRAVSGQHRHYLKGLIQLAAANYHLVRGNRGAARRLFDGAAGHLAGSEPLRWPFDTGVLLAACAAAAARLDSGHTVAPVRPKLQPMLAAWSASAHGEDFV